MSFFNQNQNSFHNPNQNLLQVAQQSNGRAVLFFFQPLARPFTDQFHRPLTYRMNEDIFNAAGEAAHRTNMGMSPSAAVAAVVNRSDTLTAILPSADPTVRIGLGSLSETWKFMLVINGDFLEPDQVAVFSRNNSGREIYFGYCMDEPLNPLTLGMSEPTVNNDARLMITHKTVLQTYPSHGSIASAPQYVTMADADVIDPTLITALSSTHMQINDPLHLSRSSELTSGEGRQVFAIPQPVSANDLSNQVSPITLDTMMQNPQENLATLMKAAILANGKLNSDKQLNRDSPFIDNVSRGDILTESMETYFQSGTSTIRSIGLRPDTIHMLGSIRQKYRPEIFPYTSDRSVLFSPYDQTTRTATTMFCSLLCSAIPPLLMQAQILHFAFQYQTRSFDTNQPDAWVVHSVQSAVPMETEILRNKVNAVMHELKTGLFRMMFDSRGDFEIHGSFGAANVTHCYLNFHCDTERMLEPFEVPTIFGGLTSTLIADHQTTMQNTSQYSALINAMTGGEVHENIPEMRDMAPIYSTTGAPAVTTTPPIIPPGIFRF